MKLSAAANARPLVLFVAFAYGLATRHSAVWVSAAVLALAEGFWWAASYRSPKGQPLHPGLVIGAAFLAWPIGALRWGAWALVLGAEWILRPALWDGGIISHGRRRRAARKARKVRAHIPHAEATPDILALGAHAEQIERAAAVKTEPTSVSMSMVTMARHVMSDGSERWEEVSA